MGISNSGEYETNYYLNSNNFWKPFFLQLHSPEKSTDIEDDKEPIKKVSTSKAVVDIPREQPKPLKVINC